MPDLTSDLKMLMVGMCRLRSSYSRTLLLQRRKHSVSHMLRHRQQKEVMNESPAAHLPLVDADEPGVQCSLHVLLVEVPHTVARVVKATVEELFLLSVRVNFISPYAVPTPMVVELFATLMRRVAVDEALVADIILGLGEL
jgi:hypothetical protein